MRVTNMRSYCGQTTGRSAVVPTAYVNSITVIVAVILVFWCCLGNHIYSSSAYAGEPMADEQVFEWFESDAQPVLTARASEVFPKMSSAEIEGLIVGAPVQIWGINNSTAAGGAHDLVPTQRWAAAFIDKNTPVGVLWAEFSVGESKDAHVKADKTLAKRIYEISQGSEAGRKIFYDTQLSAWFAMDDLSVSAADREGEKIVAGEVPIDDFMAQRDRNIGVADTGTPLNVDHSSDSDVKKSENSVSAVSALIVVLVICVLLTFSLLWLRWEAHQAQTRDAESLIFPSETPASALTVLDAGNTGTTVSLGRAAGKVNVYRRKNNDDALGSEDVNENSVGRVEENQ